MVFTDKLASYRMAHRRMIPGAQHRRSKHLNKLDGKTPNTNPSARTTGEDVQRSRPAQRFLSAFSAILQHFRPHHHRLRADAYHREMAHRFNT